MTASDKERKIIKDKLPYELLKKLYVDSRISIKQLAKEFNISHHTVSKSLKESEKKYQLYYTVDIDTNLLGFSEARIIGVNFETVPELKLLKRVLENDPFVQNAYLASGDFNLIIHVVALNYVEYCYWEYNFRRGFSHYKPRVKVSTLNSMEEGFMPINSKLIPKSEEVTDAEKKDTDEINRKFKGKIKRTIKNNQALTDEVDIHYKETKKIRDNKTIYHVHPKSR